MSPVNITEKLFFIVSRDLSWIYHGYHGYIMDIRDEKRRQ